MNKIEHSKAPDMIRNLIIKNKIDVAIEHLKQCGIEEGNIEMVTNAISLLSRYNKLQQDIHNGTINFDDQNVENGKIRKAILFQVNGINDSNSIGLNNEDDNVNEEVVFLKLMIKKWGLRTLMMSIGTVVAYIFVGTILTSLFIGMSVGLLISHLLEND